MKCIGIDIGSSSIKGGVLNLAEARVEHVMSVPFPDPVSGLPATWFEVSPAAILNAAQDLLYRLLDAVDDCQGIFSSSQMGGVILTDDSGVPVTNYISWRDQRVLETMTNDSASYLESLRSRTTDADWQQIGHELKPGAAACLLYWMSRTNHIPGHARLAMGLGDYLTAALCGSSRDESGSDGERFKTDPTMALGTYNLFTQDWHRDWFERLGFGQLQWPTLTTASSAVGHFRHQARSIPVYPAIGDHQAALMGAGLKAGELSVNVSTGSQVSQVTAEWSPGDYQTRPFMHGTYLNTITHLPAGRSLSALVDLLTELARAEGLIIKDPWAAIAAALDRTANTDLSVNLAFFASSVGDKGKIDQITLDNLNVGHLFLAAFEHMANNYADCAARLFPERNWNRIVLSGGLPHKLPRLGSLIINRLGGDSRVVDTPEETLLGLLKIAQSAFN